MLAFAQELEAEADAQAWDRRLTCLPNPGPF